MSLEVKEGASFKSVDPGTYAARCVKLIDVGTQHGEYQGKAITRKQVIIGFELPNELIEEGDFAGQPYFVSKFYTASLDKKANLRRDLEAWRGRAFTEEELKGFKLTNILGKPCMLSIVHSENGKAKISGVMAVPKGMLVGDQVNDTIVYDMSAHDDAVFNKLSEGIKKIIMASDEYKLGNEIQDNDKGPDEHSDLEPF